MRTRGLMTQPEVTLQFPVRCPAPLGISHSEREDVCEDTPLNATNVPRHLLGRLPRSLGAPHMRRSLRVCPVRLVKAREMIFTEQTFLFTGRLVADQTAEIPDRTQRVPSLDLPDHGANVLGRYRNAHLDSIPFLICVHVNPVPGHSSKE